MRRFRWICLKLMCSVKYVQKESIWREIDLFQLKRFQKDPATLNLSKLARLQKPTPNFKLGWNWLILAKKCREKKTKWNKTSVGLSSNLRKTAIGTVNLPKLACFVKNKQKTSIHCFRWKLYTNSVCNCDFAWNKVVSWKKNRKRQLDQKAQYLSSNLCKTTCENVNLNKLAHFVKNKEKISMHLTSSTVTLLEIKLFCQKRAESVTLIQKHLV